MNWDLATYQQIYAILALKPFKFDRVLPSDLFWKDQDYPLMIGHEHCRNFIEIYFALGRYYKPKTVLEIGVRYGYSLLGLIAGAVHEGTPVEKYVGWDNQSMVTGSHEVAEINLQKAGVAHIPHELRHIDSHSAGEVDGFYDIIHQDAGHSREETLQDLALTLGKCKVLLIDDYNSFGNRGGLTGYTQTAVDEFVQTHANRIARHFWIDSYEGTYVIEFSS